MEFDNITKSYFLATFIAHAKVYSSEFCLLSITTSRCFYFFHNYVQTQENNNFPVFRFLKLFFNYSVASAALAKVLRYLSQT